MCSEELSESLAATCTHYLIQGAHYRCSAVYHTASQSFLALYAAIHKPEQLAHVSWLKYEYNHTEPLLKPSAYTIVPAHFFKADKAHQYLELQGLNPLFPDSTEIPLAKSYMVAEGPPDFGAPNNVQALMLNQLMAEPVASATGIHLHVDVDKLNVFLFKEGALVMANTYSFTAKEDILYFISASLKKNGFTQQDTAFTYSGFLRPKTALLQLVLKYYPQAVPVTTHESLKFDPCFAPIAKHLYYDAFILPMCGL